MHGSMFQYYKVSYFELFIILCMGVLLTTVEFHVLVMHRSKLVISNIQNLFEAC
jgi:hypothetical protein